MTTLPIHTVEHAKSVFKKYQIIAILFTTITIAAAFLAAISGFQLAKLRKMKIAETTMAAEPVKTAKVPADDALKRQIKTLGNQLAAEKATSKKLRIKIQELEKIIETVKSTLPQQTQPVPQQSNVPAAAAPAAKSPAQPKPASEDKAVEPLPKPTPTPPPVPAEEPSKAPVKTDAKPSPEAAAGQETKTTMPEPNSSDAGPLKADTLPLSQNSGTENTSKP